PVMTPLVMLTLGLASSTAPARTASVMRPVKPAGHDTVWVTSTGPPGAMKGVGWPPGPRLEVAKICAVAGRSSCRGGVPFGRRRGGGALDRLIGERRREADAGEIDARIGIDAGEDLVALLQVHGHRLRRRPLLDGVGSSRAGREHAREHGGGGAGAR